jgi:hypothetical protein
MQQLPTFNFGLTKFFLFIYSTLSMRQKTKNYRIRGSNAQKNFFLFYFPSHIPIWVWFVQKTRAKNSHAWAPLTKENLCEELRVSTPLQRDSLTRFIFVEYYLI